MATWLKQSTAIDISIGPFVDAADGVTPETSLTITQPDIRLKKNGGAWAQKNAAQTLSHEENGWYEVALDTTDTNTLGNLLIAVNESGALPVWREFQVVPANVWDSFFGADKLQVHADEITTGLITAAAIADNAIDAGAIASGAITSAKFAAGAIDAAALATDAVTEINAPVLAVLGTPDGGSIAADIVGIFEQMAVILEDVGQVPSAVWMVTVDGSNSAAESMRLQNSALGGKLSGAGTGTETVRDLADSKDRLVYTVDSDGNRSAVVADLT